MHSIGRQSRGAALRLLLIGFVVVTLIGVATIFTAPARAATRFHHNFSTTSLEQVATAANTSGDATFIDYPLVDGKPNDILLVNQDLNPNHFCGCVINNHPIGTWYNYFIGRWAIFNEDGSAMPLGAAFGVIVWAAPVVESGRTIYTHIADPQTGADYTDLDNSISNNNPNALVYVTPNLEPPAGSHVVYDTHVLGVWYDTTTGHWAVYHEDRTAMPSYDAFNVVVYAASDPQNDVFYTVTSTPTNTASYYTNLTTAWSVTGGLDVIQRYTPCLFVLSACQSTFNHVLGSWYNGSVGHVSIFTEDMTTMPDGVTFNVMNMHF